jgi:hypothetical protein
VGAERAAGCSEEFLAGGRPERHLGRKREARKLRDPVAGREDERHEGRHDRAGQRVAEALGQAVARAVGAALGQRPAAGAEDHAAGLELAGFGAGDEAGGRLRQRRHPGRVQEPPAGLRRFADERVEHRAGRVARGKELARHLGLERDARSPEERDGVGDGEPPEHLADRGRGTAGVVGLRHPLVGDVAPPAAGHKDFRPEFAGCIEGGDRDGPARGTGRAAGPGGGEEPRRPGTDDEDVRACGHEKQRAADRYIRTPCSGSAAEAVGEMLAVHGALPRSLRFCESWEGHSIEAISG